MALDILHEPLDNIRVALLKDKMFEALELLYGKLLSETNEQMKIYAMTFEHPRKVYRKAVEQYSCSNVWRAGWLSAGESGTDEQGEYQVFSLTAEGRKHLEWDEPPAESG